MALNNLVYLISLQLIDMDVVSSFYYYQCFKKHFICVHTHFWDYVILEVCLLDQWQYMYFNYIRYCQSASKKGYTYLSDTFLKS